MTPPHRRPAPARVQVLLALGVLLLLAGLVLTGVVRLRQQAAQMTCQNNLKQLSIGLLGYTDANNRLPPLVDQGDGSPTGRGLPSVFWTLIPFLESTWRLYSPDRSDRSAAERYHAHSSVAIPFNAIKYKGVQDGGDANQVYKTFLCPSDTSADQLRDIPVTLPDGSTGYYATGSYVANGMAPWNQKWGTLNTSNTILFTERPQVCNTASEGVVYTLWGVGFYSPQMPAFATLTPTRPPGLWCTGQVAPVLPLTDGEVRVRFGWANADPAAPDFATPLQRIRSGNSCDPRLPGAIHPDGVCVGMADGSVRVFRYDTSPRVFWAACVPTE